MRCVAFIVVLLACGVAPLHAAVVGLDDFTDTGGTALSAHTPTCGGGSCGASWSSESANLVIRATTGVELIDNGASGVKHGRKEDNLGDDEHVVQCRARVSQNSTSRRAGCCGRMASGSFTNGICAILQGDGVTDATLKITKEVTGTITDLASDTGTWTLSQYYTLRLVIGNGTQNVYVDGSGTPTLTTNEADTTLQGNTFAGVVINGANTITGVDDFQSESVAAGAPENFFFRRRFGLWLQPKEWLHAVYHRLRPAV